MSNDAETKRRNRERYKQWQLANPQKAEIRRLKQLKYSRKRADHIRKYPELRVIRNKKQAVYDCAKRATDPEFAAKYNAKARRYYRKAMANPEKVEKRRRQSADAYLRIKASTERWERTRKKMVSYIRNRKKADPEFAMRCHLGARLRGVLRQRKAIKSRSALLLVGCTVAELVAHLEKQFKREMSWKNYGSVWHVDHIIPCCKFDLTDPRQQAVCFNYLNLQPMFTRENLKKGGRLAGPAQMALGLSN